MLRSTSSFHSAQGLGVAALQHHDPVARPILELLAAVELGSGLLVEPVEIADAQLRRSLGLADVDQVLDEHAERRAPIADVVLADHGVPDEFEHATSASPITVVRMLDFVGHTVIRENHVGDLGTPFGMTIEHLIDLGETEAAAS